METLWGTQPHFQTKLFIYIKIFQYILLTVGCPPHHRKSLIKERYFKFISDIFSDVAKKASPNNQSSPAIFSSNSFFFLLAI